jgi:peroxiredoxin
MTAPNFELATTTGERLSLTKALAHGPVLLAFFKVGCPTCQYTFPFLQRIYLQTREQGGKIWGLVQDRPEDATRFAHAFGVTFPILVDDPPYKVSRSYHLGHVPTLFLLKPDARIEIASEGFSKADLVAIHRSLAETLSATPPALFLPTETIPEYKPG